jgi:hypothetical protein
MKINIKELKIWITALRSGEYKQGKRRLQSNEGYCCLGVACKLFIPEDQLELDNGYLIGSLPIEHANAPQWLKKINPDFRVKTGKHLSTLNDEEGLSFDEIADVLEMVYILKVLD